MSEDRRPPRISDAPGLVWKPRKDGWEARWYARADLVQRGYTPKSIALWTGSDPNESQRAWISDRCGIFQREMLTWGRGAQPVVGRFDGTLKSLINCYQTDNDSSYRSLRYKTREHYDGMCRRLTRDHGMEEARDLKARVMLRWHEEWVKGGKIAMAHSLMGLLRTVIGFGAIILEDPDCARVRGILSGMRFKMAKPRSERITAVQVEAVRAAAHKMGMPSIALAQAFQFDLMLRQKDCIGEWVPQSEDGVSDVLYGNAKWLRGIRWEEIDGGMILRHTTSKRQKDIEANLTLAPMVMEELMHVRPRKGPLIICEITGVPWTAYEFRRQWRKVADAAGIPRSIKNMDSRAGAISEATDAGADMEHIRHAATHGNIAMTQRYSRGAAEKTANVMRQRAEHRNKK